MARKRGRILTLALFGTVLMPLEALSVSFTLINLDAPGEGLNDLTPAPPVGGNTGTTIGEQRRIAFQYAADIWGAELGGDVEIRVELGFNPLSCSEFGAVLGQAGPMFFRRDFDNAPQPSTWYVPALVNALNGYDVDPGENDIFAAFNSELGEAGCLPGTSWYYGLDANVLPPNFDFVSVVLHELAHGLGFRSLIDLNTGEKFLGQDDAFSRLLEDADTGKLFPDMNNFERSEAQKKGTQGTSRLHWTGPLGNSAAASVLDSGVGDDGHLEMYAPNPVEPNQSVSHFAKTLRPSNLLSPLTFEDYAEPNHDVFLAAQVLADIGWPRPPFCGDGTVGPAEQCDDGNFANGDGCDFNCTPTGCGNGVPTIGEACDDGNASNRDACLNDCMVATCGDGFRHLGIEECDQIGDTPECDGDCTLPQCGDAYTNEAVGEECDFGDTPVPILCGDANADDQITAADALMAIAAAVGAVVCELSRCDVNDSGSITAPDALAILQSSVGISIDLNCPFAEGEPGNRNSGACLANCILATCGDGFVHVGEEACDDGNDVSTDDCTNACEVARCGDGSVHEGNEICDDGNQKNSDSCLNDCTPASCGDRFVHAGVEDCERGNLKGATCESLGFDSGELRCFESCEFDERRCVSVDDWSGSWESRVGTDLGSLGATLSMDGFGFEGSVLINDSFCIAQGTISGQFGGATGTEVTSVAHFEFNTKVHFTGLLDGKCMRGTYEIEDGPCDGDFGVWEMCR